MKYLDKPTKLVDVCGYELPTNLQNFTQKDLTEMKIVQKVLGCYLFYRATRMHSAAVARCLIVCLSVLSHAGMCLNGYVYPQFFTIG